MARQEPRPLRRGWTTGACPAAAVWAAYAAVLTGEFPDPVTIRPPRGQKPAFPLALAKPDTRHARAGTVVARRLRAVALATLSGAIAVAVATVGHSGGFLARLEARASL